MTRSTKYLLVAAVALAAAAGLMPVTEASAQDFVVAGTHTPADGDSQYNAGVELGVAGPLHLAATFNAIGTEAADVRVGPSLRFTLSEKLDIYGRALVTANAQTVTMAASGQYDVLWGGGVDYFLTDTVGVRGGVDYRRAAGAAFSVGVAFRSSE